VTNDNFLLFREPFKVDADCFDGAVLDPDLKVLHHLNLTSSVVELAEASCLFVPLHPLRLFGRK